MSWLDDLPRTPPLVRVTVLALALGGAAHAGPPEEAERWAAAGVDLRDPLEIGDARVTVVAQGTGPSEAVAAANARVAAWQTLLSPLAATDPELATVLVPTATSPAPPPLVELYRGVHRDPGRVQVIARYTLPRTAYDDVTLRASRTAGFAGVGRLARDPDGRTVVIRGGLGLVAGDVVVGVAGTVPGSLDDLGAALVDGAVVDVVRSGARSTFSLVAIPVKDDWTVRVAPTCGPCCHGFCGDTPLVPPE